MSKRKNAPHAKSATVHDLSNGGERIVHREAMTATVGDVLEFSHTDDAIKLLYAQDNLAAGRPLNDPVALMGEAVMNDTVDTAVDRAREENAAEASSTPSSSSPSVSPAAPAGLSRFLSPRFVVKATRDAVRELLGGVRQARQALGQATVRARQCFVPAAE